MGVNKLFDISRRSLIAYQAALNATSNNISNASNPNYSRQRVLLGSEKPESSANLSFGSGVKVDAIQRIRDSIIDSQMWSYNANQSLADKQASSLSKLEALLSEPSDLGLSNLITQFFNSWDQLAVDPASSALRNNVLNAAQSLTGKLGNIYTGYTEIRTDIKSEASQIVNSINSFLSQIYTLNKEIYANSATGTTPNDLLDKRGAVINELSKLANINVTYNADQSVSISIGGIFSVDRLHQTVFSLDETTAGLRITANNGQSNLALNGGELLANLETYNNVIPNSQTELNTIGNAIYTSVNALHSTGFTNTSPTQTSIDFFSSFADGTLVVNQNLIDDPDLIAASADGQDGNNEIALQIAALRESGVINGETISTTYASLVNDIANKIQLHTQNSESFQLVINQLDKQITELSGVSVDEEMVNVIKFQRSYDAAAKLIRVADEMFQTLLNAI